MINILVPIDFSDAAKKAVEYAVYVAGKTEAKVLILHVYETPVLATRSTLVTYPEVIKDNIRFAESQLNDLTNVIQGLKEIRFELKFLPMNWIAELPEILFAQNPDLIIMGTNGASGLKEIFLGSNTAAVIDRAKCPVLAVPIDAQCSKIEKIAFAYDREFIDNLSTFDFLIWFTRVFTSTLEVFHVKGPDDGGASPGLRHHMEELKRYLDEIPHTYSETTAEDIEEEINNYLSERNIDVLVMMHRSRTLFDRLFRRSFSKKMSYRSTTPLLILNEKSDEHSRDMKSLF